jgi:RNA polymerase sigma-70 factor, ECF subfamily
VKGTGVRLQLRHGQARRHDAARQAAFAELHRDHAAEVYNLALRLVGNREDARDISQDVLLKAFERLGKPGELHRRAWLYRVTVNACYDHLRTQRRRPRSDGEAPELVSPVDGYEQAELLRAVEAALRGLPPAQRAALLLREVHGLPTGEVAYALGTTADSAAVTLTRARKTFRRKFLDARATDGVTPDVAVQGAGALALGLWLPRLHLPSVPLPAGLENPALLTAASTGASISASHSDVTIGFMAHLAELLSTKAGAAAASATVLTGSIGGAYAAAHAATHATPVAPAPRTAAKHHVRRTVAGAPGHAQRTAAVLAAATATPMPAVTVAGAPAPTPSANATSPSPTPSDTATPITLGEGGGTPTPQPSASAQPTATPTPTPSDTATVQPSPSDSASPEASASATPTLTPTP